MAHVYFLKKKDKIVYVGRSANDPMGRIKTHQSDKTKKFDSFSFIETDHFKNDAIEKILIAHYKPIYNNPLDCYPELNLVLLKLSFKEDKKYKEAVKYVNKNNVSHYKFNGNYYVSKKDIDEIKEEIKGQYYFNPLEIVAEINQELKDVIKIVDGKIIMKLSKED